MKRILSALLVCILVVTMSTTMVLAADINYAFTADKTALVPGDIVTLTLKLDSNPGLAYYKNIVSFDATAFERTTITYTNSDDEEVTEDIKSSWGAPTINDGQSGKTIMTWSNSSNKTGKTMLTMCYEVKDTAVNGTYSFTVECEEAKNASFELLSIAPSTTADITISGGVEPGQGGGEGGSIITDENSDGVYDVADTAATDALKGKKVVFGSVANGKIVEATRLKVTNNNIATDNVRIFGSNLAEKLGIQGGGELAASKVKFGIVFDASNTTWTAANFTFELVNAAE